MPLMACSVVVLREDRVGRRALASEHEWEEGSVPS